MLVWGANFHALPLEVRNKWSSSASPPIFDECRKGLATLPSTNEFEFLLVQSFPQNFPALYLEGYHRATSETLSRYSRIPPVIASTVGWYYNEPFKFLAAEASSRPCRLLTAQHGGGYGIYRFSAPELHERRVGDSFMVWGWADEETRACRNLPSFKLSTVFAGQPRKSTRHRTDAILYVATAHPRYLYRFHSMPVGSQWEAYFEWQVRFLTATPERIRRAVRFRPQPHDFGQAVRVRILERFNDVFWEDGQPFQHALDSSRMVVVDHAATTFLEALVANIPTVLFWDPHRWEARSEAEPYFESLRSVGVLWDSPETAAAKVEEVYNEPWRWWGEEVLQDARQSFVDRYALSREDWLDCWVKALKEEIGTPPTKRK
jgi:putative transferase (TIGR04331 family)